MLNVIFCSYSVHKLWRKMTAATNRKFTAGGRRMDEIGNNGSISEATLIIGLLSGVFAREYLESTRN